MREFAVGPRAVRHVEQLFGAEVRHRQIALIAKDFLQVLQRMEHVRLDGPDRAAQRRGDFLMRHIVVHPKNQRGALFARQLRDGGAHARGPLAPQHAIVGAFAGALSTCCRSSIGSVRGALTLTRFRHTFTPIRYSQVPSDECPRKFRSPR